MKKKILSLTLFISSVVLIFADQIDDNKTKIKQIDSQINKNSQKINQNKGEIKKAKTNENITLSQVRDIITLRFCKQSIMQQKKNILIF